MGAINFFSRFLFFAITGLLLIIPAYAEDYAVVEGYSHAFNNKIGVYSGVFALNKDLSLETSAYFKYTVDLINPGADEEVTATSGASSAASGGSDTRNALTAGVSHNFNNIIGVEAYYDYSKEKDYVSNTPTISLKKDLFDKNTTITLGLSRNMDRIEGRFMDKSESRNTNNYFAGITQVLSPVTVAQIGYSRSRSEGFESEGIRLVPLNGVDKSTCTAESATCVDEAFPGSRNRSAYIASVNHYFLKGPTDFLKKASVKFTYRYYEDDWDINSHMGEVEYNKYLDERQILRLDYRYYIQARAFFVKDTYTGAEEFKSVSPQIEEFDTHLFGVKYTYLLPEEKNVKGKVRPSALEGKYEYYTESTGVNAHILMAGVKFAF